MSGFDFTLTLENLGSILVMFLDIFIVWLILYYVLCLVRVNSKTSQIFKGILFVVVVDALSKFLGLKTLEYFADMFINWGFLALIIIFQPELRTILERLGKSNVFTRITTLTGNEKENLVDQVVTAMMLLSKDKTGALISIERTPQSLDDYVATGTKLHADVSAEILTSIFVTTTPLHDGAVIIQGDKIACASAYFPPTNMDLPGRYGARHRAAVGISEVTDAVTLIVSEETGRISIAEGGRIRTVNEKQLREYLMRVVCDEVTEVKPHNNKRSGDTQKKASLVKKLALRRQEDEDLSTVDANEERDMEEEKIEELQMEADRIKLPQNHKHDRPVPSYPQRTHTKVAPVEVTAIHDVSQRMTPEEVEAARKASVEKLKHRSTPKQQKPVQVDEKQFDTMKLNISHIVGFDGELKETMNMVDQMDPSSKERQGGDH